MFIAATYAAKNINKIVSRYLIPTGSIVAMPCFFSGYSIGWYDILWMD